METVAFKNTNDSLVCVLMNKTDKAVDYVLRIGDLTAKLKINPEGIQSLVIYDV